MVKLVGGTHFLILRGDGSTHTVECYRRFDEAVAKHDGNSRISPIFSVAGSSPPTFEKDKPCHLLFLGPKYPGETTIPDGIDCYLTLGLLNLVLFSDSAEKIDSLRDSLASGTVGWERWTLIGNVITEVEHHFPGRSSAPTEVTEPIGLDRKPLTPTAREFQTALACAVGKAQLYKQPTEQLLLNYNKVLRRFLIDDSIQDVERLQFLAIANVSIARLTWQTYGGTSRIYESQIPIAMHSLLGIGTAVLGLHALTRFVEQVFESHSTRTDLERLENIPAHNAGRLLSIPATDNFWNRDFFARATDEIASRPDGPNLPQFATFSGRDGFRSTSISLSAPTESITGCNTPSWTLQTLTHEMSHTQVRIALGFLLPDFAIPDDVQAVWTTITQPDSATNLRTQVRAFLAESIRQLSSKGTLEALSREEFFAALKDNLDEAHEILTHTFDFLYFYRGDEKTYLRAVWVSWASIPHIEDRVKNYIVRVLCAVYASNLRRDNGVTMTLESVESALVELNTEFPDSLYIPEAISELRLNREEYLGRLRLRGALVKFARYFLWSKDVAAMLSKDADLASHLVGGTFTEERIKNPLAFIGAWSQEKIPDAIRSAWILQQLAYGMEP